MKPFLENDELPVKEEQIVRQRSFPSCQKESYVGKELVLKLQLPTSWIQVTYKSTWDPERHNAQKGHWTHSMRKMYRKYKDHKGRFWVGCSIYVFVFGYVF